LSIIFAPTEETRRGPLNGGSRRCELVEGVSSVGATWGVPGAELDCEPGGVLTIFAVEWLLFEKTFLMESLIRECFWSGERIAEDFERLSLGKEKKLFSFLIAEDGVAGTAGPETGETGLLELSALFGSLVLLFAEVAEGTEILCEACD